MKKLLLFFFLLIAANNIQAQEVYMQIRQRANEMASSNNSNDAIRQMNRFKVDALDYMAMKMKEQMPDSTATFLDKEAFALNNFMSLYMQTLLQNRDQPANYQLKLLKLFIDASVSNPLFNDSDKELVYSYFNDENSLTRFSLDTDWRRAHVAAYTMLKRMQQ